MSPQTQPRSGGPAPMRRSPLPDPARKPVSVKRWPSKSRSKSPANKVEKLPIARKGIPLWLRSLVLLQKSTSLLLFLAVGATVTVYSWKEHVETEWSKEYKQLNTLLQEERELTATNEILKNQIANQAEKEETGLNTSNSNEKHFSRTSSLYPSGGRSNCNCNQETTSQQYSLRLLA